MHDTDDTQAPANAPAASNAQQTAFPAAVGPVVEHPHSLYYIRPIPWSGVMDRGMVRVWYDMDINQSLSKAFDEAWEAWTWE